MSVEPEKLLNKLETDKKEQRENSQSTIQQPPFATDTFLPFFKLAEVKHKRAQLGPQKPFVHFNLDLSEAEKLAWAELRVEKQSSQLSLYGVKNLLLLVKQVLQEAGNSPSISDVVAKSVERLVNEMVYQFSAETAWICMRLSLKNNNFDVPRWHTDGYYTAPPEGELHKVVMALKGRHTLFYNLPLLQRTAFMALESMSSEGTVDHDDINHRIRIAQLIDIAKIDSPTPPAGTIFIAGAEHAAVHSEPPFDSDRIFLSIFPCSFKQAEAMKRDDEVEITTMQTNYLTMTNNSSTEGSAKNNSVTNSPIVTSGPHFRRPQT